VPTSERRDLDTDQHAAGERDVYDDAVSENDTEQHDTPPAKADGVSSPIGAENPTDRLGVSNGA
jgi:hypothetical protein